MRMYMAGGVSGNLKPFWSGTRKLVQEGRGFEDATEESMRLFLAGQNGMHRILSEQWESNTDFVLPNGYDDTIRNYRPYILESFFYVDEDTERLLPHFGDFLLDSGAFTFMQNNGGTPNWDEYIERYAAFINRNHIDKFFELDIDSVVGYERVKDLRRKLERLTCHPVIPVWHVSRGVEEYRRMCDEYDYVAIGGIVSKEIPKEKYGAFPMLINEAHKRRAKVHGLGFTYLALLEKYHFDSVDSTSWTIGNRFGYLYWFDGRTMQRKSTPHGHRIGNSRLAAVNNYMEWIKYQMYADAHL